MNDMVIGVAINLNPYQGLKPNSSEHVGETISCCNQPKSLSGIETPIKKHPMIAIKVAINLNPYQGLKHFLGTRCHVVRQLQST